MTLRQRCPTKAIVAVFAIVLAAAPADLWAGAGNCASCATRGEPAPEKYRGASGIGTELESKASKTSAEIHHRLGANGRIISIKRFTAGGVHYLEIFDLEGPSERSYFSLWQYARMSSGKPIEPKTWSVLPEEKRVLELRLTEAKECRHYTRGKAPLYKLPPYGTALTVQLRGDSLEGFENVGVLREEAKALANEHIDKFVAENRGLLVERYRTAKEEFGKYPHDDEGDPNTASFDLTRDRVINIERYIGHLNVAKIELESLAKPPEHASLLRSQEDTLQRALLAGVYVAPMKPAPHYHARIEVPTLIVVHAHDICIGPPKVAARINAIVAQFKAKGLPVIYLMTGETQKIQAPGAYTTDSDFYGDHWVLADRAPTAPLFSAEGHHALELATADIVVVGAYWGQCHLRATLDAIHGHFRNSTAPVNVHFPTGAIREAGSHDTIEDNLLKNGPEAFGITTASEFFGYGFDSGGMCIQSRMFGIALSYARYRFNTYVGDTQIGSVGSGAAVVNLRYWDTDMFEKRIVPSLSM